MFFFLYSMAWTVGVFVFIVFYSVWSVMTGKDPEQKMGFVQTQCGYAFWASLFWLFVSLFVWGINVIF